MAIPPKELAIYYKVEMVKFSSLRVLFIISLISSPGCPTPAKWSCQNKREAFDKTWAILSWPMHPWPKGFGPNGLLQFNGLLP